MKKALIFGIGGFVGGYLATELISHGYQVFGSDVTPQHPDGVPFYQADLLNEAETEATIAAVTPDVIVNLAAISSVGLSWKIPQKTFQVNVIGALNILEAVKKSGKSTKVLFIGSSEEYAFSDQPISERTPLNANNPYGISKTTQERFAESYFSHYGMQVHCVRAFNHTGIGQAANFVIPSWCKQVAAISQSGKPGVMRVGNLGVRRDFSDVRDIVRAYRLVLKEADCTTIYNIGSGQAVLLEDLLTYLVSLSEQPIEIQVDSQLIRPTDTPSICCDHSLITQQLGWQPQHTIYDTVKEMVNYYKKGGK